MGYEVTLPASGTISLTDVMNELRVTNPGRAYPISLGDSDVRALAGVPSGSISMSNLYGKSSYVAMSVTGHSDSQGASSAGGGGTVTCHPSVSVSNGSGSYTYAWSFTSNPSSCGLNAATSATCNVSHTFSINANGSASATLQCVVSDGTASVTASGIAASLDWSN